MKKSKKLKMSYAAHIEEVKTRNTYKVIYLKTFFFLKQQINKHKKKQHHLSAGLIYLDVI